MRTLRCCLNPKVIGSLAVLGMVIWLVTPGVGAAALPLLIGLICPLSMGLMAWRMRRNGNTCDAPPAGLDPGRYVDAELRAVREELMVVKAQRALARHDGDSLR